MSMNIHAKKGDKVRYNGINGSDDDKHFASIQGLIIGKEYTVEKMYLSEFNTGVALIEDELCVFNSVMFDDVEQTLEEQVNECKEQTEDVAFIAIDDGRTLLKIDRQGFVTIGETVVGHEPGLPKYFKPTIKESLIVEPEFNPSEPFEVSDHEGKEWYTPDNSSYVGQDKNGCHLLLIECQAGFELDEYQSFPHIRNVKKQDFMEGDPVWGKQKYCNPNGKWLFGTFAETKDGSLVINYQNDMLIKCTEIRPFFVDGVATYPPKFDQHENN